MRSTIVTLYLSGCCARVAAQDCLGFSWGEMIDSNVQMESDHSCGTSANDDDLLPPIFEQRFIGHDDSCGRANAPLVVGEW